MRYSVRFSLLLALACVASPACAGDAAASEKMPVVIPVGGVSHGQALDIARAYFLTHVFCGALQGVTDAGHSWKVEGQFGYAGAPIEGFLINKATGALTLPEFWVE